MKDINYSLKFPDQNITKKNPKKPSFLLISSITILFLFILFIYSLNPISLLNFNKNDKNDKNELKPIIINHYDSPYHSDNILNTIFYPYTSDIITNIDEFEFLRDTLGKVNFKMLFNSNIHGDHSKDFKKLTTKKYILMLVKTSNGNRFGGYTSHNFSPVLAGLSQNAIDIVKSDPCSFLFNLDTKKIYEINEENESMALSCDDYSTVGFGENDLFIPNHFLTNNGKSEFPVNFGKNAEKNELTGGEEKFKIVSLEAYQVIFYEEFGDEKNRMGEEKLFIR